MGILSARQLNQAARALAPTQEKVSTTHKYKVVSAGDATCVLDVGGNEVGAVCEMAVHAGDMVRVRWQDGILYVQGDEDAPATDDTTADEANDRIDELEEEQSNQAGNISAAARAAQIAQGTADKAVADAAKIAGATGQYFFHDDSGAHVTTTANTATGAFNAIWNTGGLMLRKLSTVLMELSDSALSFYDGEGNEKSNIMAQFTSTIARIGKIAAFHVNIIADSMAFYNGETTLGSISAFDESDSGYPVSGMEMSFDDSTDDVDVAVLGGAGDDGKYKQGKLIMKAEAGLNPWGVSEYYANIGVEANNNASSTGPEAYMMAVGAKGRSDLSLAEGTMTVSGTEIAANTVFAASSLGYGAKFRKLVADDIPSLAISKITNLQSTLNGKAASSHTHKAADLPTPSLTFKDAQGSASVTLGANARTNVTVTVTPDSGYKICGLRGYNVGGAAGVNVMHMSRTSTGWTVALSNMTNESKTFTLTVSAFEVKAGW